MTPRISAISAYDLPLELAEDDRLPLLRRNLRERSEELADSRAVLVVRLVPGDPVI